MIRRFTIFGLAVVASVASAQSRSSFGASSSITGLAITSSSELDFRVALSNAATMVYQGQTRQITEVFGFWLLDDNDDLHGSGVTGGGWQYHENYSGSGGIAGFKTNPNAGVKQGEGRDFTFRSVVGVPETYGVHLRLDDGNTYYVEAPAATVPEPATLAVLGVGISALIRRRRAKR